MSTSWIGVFLEGIRPTTYASSEQTEKTTMIIGAVVLVAIMSCWLIPIWSRRQRYIPGVPIIGGSNPTSIKKSRLRFVHDSMSMLLQGYREVSCGDRPGTRGEQTLMDLWIDSRGSLLRPDQTWREIDAPGQVPRGSEMGAHGCSRCCWDVYRGRSHVRWLDKVANTTLAIPDV